MKRLFWKLALIAIMAGSFVLPVGAQVDISIESIQNESGVTLVVTSTQPVSCVLNLYSSAHQQLTYDVSEDFSVTIAEWDLGWSSLFCNGSTAGGDTQIGLQNGYTVKVQFVITEAPPEPQFETKSVEGVTETRGGQSFFVFTVTVSGDYYPECILMEEHPTRGALSGGTLTPSTSIILPVPGEAAIVTLQCDGITAQTSYGGNTLPYDGEAIRVRIDSDGGNGNTNPGGRAGNNTVKPQKPFLIEEDRVCWIGSVRVFVRDGNILVYGPEDVSTSENVILLANATKEDIAQANIANGNVQIGWSLNGLVNIYRLSSGEVQIDVIDPRSAPKKDICWLNADGTLLRTGWEG